LKKQNEMYLEADILELPRSLEPAITSWLFRQGCWGTKEKLDFTQSNLRYPPEITKKKFIDMTAYFSPSVKETLEIELSRWLHDHSPGSKISWHLQKNQDWLHEWKKHFKTFKLSGLNFVPSWLYSKKYKLAESIIVEPGMAFGTGSHATTRFAIEILKKLETKNILSGASILDVGAGSGILSVVGERFAAAEILAVDNDPECWRECEKMFKLNKSKNCKVTKKQIAQIKKKYDVVLANIIDGVLISLKRYLWRCLRPGGYLVLSGILTDGATAFEKSFLDKFNGEVVFRLNDEEWTAILIRKLK
jgi:ribosomal protein L11 methyltransferase